MSFVKNDVRSLRQEMKAGFHKVSSQIKDLTSAIYRSLALHEEQNPRNKYVLDGYQVLHDRQDRFEEKCSREVLEIRQVLTAMNSRG